MNEQTTNEPGGRVPGGKFPAAGGRGCLYVVGAALLLLAAAARACAARTPGPDALRTTCRTTAPAV